MIILVSTIILSLSGINIIERANEAVRAYNKEQITTVSQTIWSEGYLTNKTKASIKEKIVKAVGQNKAEDFNIVVTNTGVIIEDFPEGWDKSVSEVINGVPIPNGFVISPYKGENTVQEGLVIYALTEDEIKDGVYDITKIDEEQQYSLENRNQFVWVPVSKNNFATEFVRDRFGYNIDKYWSTTGINDNWYSNTLGSNTAEKGYFWEVELDDTNMPNYTQSSTNFMSDTTLKEVQAMYASVKKYGGFYIARYEAGASTTEKGTNFGRGTLSITMAKVPYNAVPWVTTMKNEVATNGAVTLSRGIYDETNTNYGVISTLTYGVQWDRTLSWIKSIKGATFDLTNSTEYGNYSDTIVETADFNENAKFVLAAPNSSSAATGFYDVDTWTPTTDFPDERRGTYMMTTGALSKANLCNIYDMAGNMYEWTMEGYSSSRRVRRGGGFHGGGTNAPLAARDYNDSAYVFAVNGFRPSLYIK